MSLTTPTRNWPLDHTLESLSGAGALVLVTSLVSFYAQVYIQAHKIGNKVSHLIFRHFEPSSILSRAALLILIPALLSGPISRTVRSPYAAIPLAFAAYWSGLAFFTLAYRLSQFHPLAKYPGPFLAKTSKWWAAYLSGTGDQHRYLKRLHDRYGDVVRIGSNTHPPFKISQPTRFQVPTSSPFATHPLSKPYSARVACAKAHVCTCHVVYWPTCRLVMTRLGWAAWAPFSNCSARPREAHAATQTMESSIFVHSAEGIRSYYG
jgi:hypothetical protein